jgi:hypothetical protein
MTKENENGIWCVLILKKILPPSSHCQSGLSFPGGGGRWPMMTGLCDHPEVPSQGEEHQFGLRLT